MKFAMAAAVFPMRFLHRLADPAQVDFLVRGALGLPGKRYPFSMSYDRIGAAEIVLGRSTKSESRLRRSAIIYAALCRSLKRNGFHVIADAIDVLTDLTRTVS